MNQRLIHLRKTLDKKKFQQLNLKLVSQAWDYSIPYSNVCEKCANSQTEILNYLEIIDENSKNLEGIKAEVETFKAQKLPDIEKHLEKVHIFKPFLVGNQYLFFFLSKAIHLNINLFLLYYWGFIYWSLLNALILVVSGIFIGFIFDYITPYLKKTTQPINRNYNHFYNTIRAKYYQILEKNRIQHIDIQTSKIHEMLQYAYLISINASKSYFEQAKTIIEDFFNNAENYSKNTLDWESSLKYRNQYLEPLYRMISPQYKVFHTKHYRLITWYLGALIILIWYFLGNSNYNFHISIFVLCNYYGLGYFLDYRLRKKFIFQTNIDDKYLNFIEIKNKS